MCAKYRAFSLKQVVHVATTVLKWLENSQYLSVYILDTWDCNYFIIIILFLFIIIVIMNQSFCLFVSFRHLSHLLQYSRPQSFSLSTVNALPHSSPPSRSKALFCAEL